MTFLSARRWYGWSAGRILNLDIGGGSLELTSGEDELPEHAFSGKPYVTDWLDTEESQRLLTYQRHTFADIAGAIAGKLGWRRHLMPVAGPIARRAMLALSPYHRALPKPR